MNRMAPDTELPVAGWSPRRSSCQRPRSTAGPGHRSNRMRQPQVVERPVREGIDLFLSRIAGVNAPGVVSGVGAVVDDEAGGLGHRVPRHRETGGKSRPRNEEDECKYSDATSDPRMTHVGSKGQATCRRVPASSRAANHCSGAIYRATEIVIAGGASGTITGSSRQSRWPILAGHTNRTSNRGLRGSCSGGSPALGDTERRFHHLIRGRAVKHQNRACRLGIHAAHKSCWLVLTWSVSDESAADGTAPSHQNEVRYAQHHWLALL